MQQLNKLRYVGLCVHIYSFVVSIVFYTHDEYVVALCHHYSEMFIHNTLSELHHRFLTALAITRGKKNQITTCKPCRTVIRKCSRNLQTIQYIQ